MSEVGAIFTQVNEGELYLSKEVDGYLEIIKSAYVEMTLELDRIKELQIKGKQEIEGIKELQAKDKQAPLILQEELKNFPDIAEMKTFYERELKIFINATKDAEEYVVRIKDEIATMMSETEAKCKEQIRMTNNSAFKIIMDARAKATEMINKAGGK